MVNLTIDGHSVSVPEETSILEAAKSIGIDIPNFCYDMYVSSEKVAK